MARENRKSQVPTLAEAVPAMSDELLGVSCRTDTVIARETSYGKRQGTRISNQLLAQLGKAGD